MAKHTKLSNNNHYINAREFAEELRICQQQNEVSLAMYRYFQLLARKCSGSFIYTSNDDRNDCISHAVVIMAKSYQKFDFEKKETANAFSYFTSVALNGLRQGWNELNSKNGSTYRLDTIFTEHL